MQLSPKEAIESPNNEAKTKFLMTGTLEQDSFGEGPKDIKLPKYFNVLNEDGIEKRTYYQDDQSNFAEARSLLKALDRVVGEEDNSKNIIKTYRILDGISTQIKNSESFDEQSQVPSAKLTIPNLN